MTDQEICEELNNTMGEKAFNNRQELTTFFTVNLVVGLVDKGLIECPLTVSEQGKFLFIKMRELGFDPSPEEVIETFKALNEALNYSIKLKDGLDLSNLLGN